MFNESKVRARQEWRYIFVSTSIKIINTDDINIFV